MYIQIREIVLWPKRNNLKPRRLKFEPEKLNVITGSSRSGKSAIIPIIDYCLGAAKCRIPVNTIRNSCEWFGVIIDTPTGEKLMARREPGSQKATGDMFIIEGGKIEIPNSIPEKNTNAYSVKRYLDELVGLTDLDFEPEAESSAFMGRPSFRDLVAMIFQPQNIVANPDIFFYKTDTYKHRNKLINIFPYLLNAITPELMAKKHELSELRRILRRKNNELESVKKVSEKWLSEIRSKVSTGMELGLIDHHVGHEVSRAELIDLLKKVVSSSSAEIKVTELSVSNSVKELIELQKEESDVSMELSGQRKRLTEMTMLRETASEYKESLNLQRDRLQISKWLCKTHQENHDCPICGNQISKTKEKLDTFINALKKVENEAGRVDTIPVAFDREYERVKVDIRNFVEKLKGVKIRIKALEQDSKEAKQRQYDSLKASRFIGNIEESLKIYERVGSDSELISEVNKIQSQVTNLEKELSKATVKAKVNRALAIISSNVNKLLPLLDIERPDDPVELIVEDLTIKVLGVNRDDYLWEIGSGSNWLSYHVAMTLGLHQYFLELNHSPVPSFIVYDQPSQVYFPKRLVVKEDEEEDFDPTYSDEDIVAVRKIFNTMAKTIEKNDGSLQIITLDHASDEIWGEIKGVHCVEEWRNGIKLIPQEWFS